MHFNKLIISVVQQEIFYCDMNFALAVLLLRLSSKTQPRLVSNIYHVDHEAVIQAGQAFGGMNSIEKISHFLLLAERDPHPPYAETFPTPWLQTIQCDL